MECSDNIQTLNIFSSRKKFNEFLKANDERGNSGSLSDSVMFQPAVKPVKAKREAVASAASNAPGLMTPKKKGNRFVLRHCLQLLSLSTHNKYETKKTLN